MSITGPEVWIKTLEVTAYLYRLGHLLDDFKIDAFVEEFVDDGSYRLVARNNYERGLKVHIINDDKSRLRYRRDLILKHWHYEKFRATRVLSNVEVTFATKERADTVSNFVIYHTNAEGVPALHLVGKFLDCVVWDRTRWRIKDRLAILENFLPDQGIVVPP